MKKSKLISYLSTFSRDELKSFAQFIGSPYFNTKPDLIKLYTILQEAAPEFPKKSIEKTIIYKQLYPNTSFNEKHLGYLMSDLSKLAEQFLIIEKGRQKQIVDDAYFLDVLIERKLNKLFQQNFRKVTKELEAVEVHDTEFYLKKYLVYDTGVRFQLSQQIRKSDENRQIVTDTLDNFYFAQKLKNSCSMLNNLNILATDYEIKYLKEIQQFIEQDTKPLEPCIEAYYLVSKMLGDEKEPAHFEVLKSFIYQRIEELTAYDARYFYHLVINYCARRIREGQRSYREECLHLYLHGIKNEILFENNLLSPWVYKNIINLSLSLRPHDWVEYFIRQYTPRLEEKFQDDALHFNLANLYFHQKDLDKALFHLHQTHFSDISYNIGSKAMLARIYYELKEEEALLSLIASFSLFLKRKKTIAQSVKIPYLNFCSILNKIMRRNPKKLAAIKEEVETTQYLNARSWLRNVVKEWEEES